jgi:phosphodiesterase/alkaline phosphatase D-like protein
VILTAMNRRDFLRLSGTFFAAASLGGVAGVQRRQRAGDRRRPRRAAGGGTFLFPQGVGSGDPRETSVVLWTRVRADASGGGRRRRCGSRWRATPAFATVVVTQMDQRDRGRGSRACASS